MSCLSSPIPSGQRRAQRPPDLLPSYAEAKPPFGYLGRLLGSAATFKNVETTTIEIVLVGDAILGRQPPPDALTWHCATSLLTNDTGREERKFHCGLHKAIQGARRLAARLDERRHQCALLDLSQTIPHCGFAYLSRPARPTKDQGASVGNELTFPRAKTPCQDRCERWNNPPV